MSNLVQRFLLTGCPSPQHPKYYPWTIGQICILIGEDDPVSAFQTAKEMLFKNHWVPISGIHRSTLIEELILKESRQAIAIYNEVKEGKPVLEATTQNWTSFKNRPPVLFPKITEQFIDRVITQAGGSRFEYDEKLEKRNADYLLNGYIIELKIMEEERLVNDLVKTKIAGMYEQSAKIEQVISAADFAGERYSAYTNIFRSPIQNAVKSASKQINATRELLKYENLKGGLLIINNGTSSITSHIFSKRSPREHLKKIL